MKAPHFRQVNTEVMRCYIEFISNVPQISRDAWIYINEHSDQVHLPPKTTLISAGQVSDTLYMVRQGTVHHYIQQGNNSITTEFIRQEGIFPHPTDFYFQIPSVQNFGTLSPCVLQTLSHTAIVQLLRKHPDIKKVIPTLITQKMNPIIERGVLVKWKPPRKFHFFLQHYPNLINEAPRKSVASYLGVTPECLSRILSKNRRRNKED